MANRRHDKIARHLTGSGGTIADPRSPAGGCGPGQSKKCGSLGTGLDIDLARLGLHPFAPNNKFGSVLTSAATKPNSARTYSATYDAHDQAVMKRINRFIDLANGVNANVSYGDATPAERAELVNIEMIKNAINAKPPTGGTVADKLDWCWAQNIKFREATDTMDPVGRDADYYFAARHEIAEETLKKYFEKYLGKQYLGEEYLSEPLKYLEKAGGAGLWTFYSAIKLFAILAGHDEWTRTDPDKPNAMPGGIDWLIRGADDGIADRGQDKAEVQKHTPAPVRILLD